MLGTLLDISLYFYCYYICDHHLYLMILLVLSDVLLGALSLRRLQETENPSIYVLYL